MFNNFIIIDNIYLRIGGELYIKSSIDILAINLKYFRYESNLSQEKFAEALGTDLKYENQLEKCRRNPSLNMIDKISDNISKLLGYEITTSELLLYDENKIVNARRVDERKK